MKKNSLNIIKRLLWISVLCLATSLDAVIVKNLTNHSITVYDFTFADETNSDTDPGTRIMLSAASDNGSTKEFKNVVSLDIENHEENLRHYFLDLSNNDIILFGGVGKIRIEDVKSHTNNTVDY